MFNRDDSFRDPSLCIEECSSKKYLHAGNNVSISDNHCLDEFSFKLNYSQEITDKSSTEYQSHNSTLSLRQNLQLMEKEDIIELLLEEVKYSQQTKQKNINLKPQKHTNKQILEKINRDSSESINFKRKYEELVKDFEEYISNTREAQRHFAKTIDDLKKQNRDLQISLSKANNQSPNMKSSNPSSFYFQISNKEKTSLVQKLEETIQKYLEINNQLIGKIQKLERLKNEDNQHIINLKKAVQKLEFECDTLEKENELLLNENENFRNIIQQLKLYIKQKRQAKDMFNSGVVSFNVISQRLKDLKNNRLHESILEISQIQHKPNHSAKNEDISSQNLKKSNHPESDLSFQSVSHQQFFDHKDLNAIKIQNKELKLVNIKLQQIIEKKSQKIRKLLEEIEVMSEEKLLMRQEILKLKNFNQQISQLGEFKEGHKITETLSLIQGGKMLHSSIYSLKNSQSTCLETSKGSNNDENRKLEPAEKRSAIRQAYNNCFKKQSQNKNIVKEESNSKIKSEITKNQQSYLPRVLDFSNKKNSEKEELIRIFENSPKHDIY